MGFPSDKELRRVRKLLENAEPSRSLPENPTLAQVIKYKICEKFIIYLMDHKMTQVQLAEKMKVDPARINEIVKYRINLFTVDKLLELAERLQIDIKVEVA